MPQHSILLIDDQPLVLSAIAHYLSQHGYVVHTATDGREGLAKAETVHPDLVITDVVMPVMDGWELVRTLRARPEFALLPVIILTDQDSSESRIQGFRIGADDFVSKTTLVEELEVRIARALERAASIAQVVGGQQPAVSPPRHEPSRSAASPREPGPAAAGFDLPPLAEAMGKSAPPRSAAQPAPPGTPPGQAASPAGRPESAGIPGIQGSLDDIGLASVLTLLSSGEQTGILTLAEKGSRRKGRLFIRSGQLLKINLDDGQDLPPAQAIAQIMGWKDATFSFSHQDVTSRDTIQSGMEHLLMEASQYVDEGGS